MKFAQIIRRSVLFAVVLCVMFQAASLVRAQETITLKVWVVGGDYKAIIEKFNKKYPNVKVNIEVVDGSVYLERLLTAAAANDAPDVIYTNSAQSSTLIDKGILYPVDKSIVGDVDQHLAVLTEAHRAPDGTLYALPRYAGGVNFFYNVTMAKEAGFDAFPTTWDGLQDWGKKTTKYDAKNEIIREGISWGRQDTDFVTRFLFRQLLLSQGADIVTADGKKAAFNNDAGLKGLQFWHDSIWVQKVSLPPNRQLQVPQGSNLLTAGLAAAQFGEPWFPVVIDAALKAKPDFAWNVAYAFPAPKGGVNVLTAGGDAWAVTKQCKHPAEAFAFIQTFNDKDAQIQLFLQDKHPVSRTDAMTSPEVRAYLQKVWPSAKNYLDLWTGLPSTIKATSVMHHPQQPTIDRILHEYIIKAMNDERADLKSVLAAMESEINNAISK